MNKEITMRFWGLVLIAVATVQPAWAKMYKWVDEQGKTHYGDTIPAQYAGQGNAELNKGGMAVKKTEGALSEGQRKVREEEQARLNAEKQKAVDVERRDKALLNTYTTDKEIDLARDRHLQGAEAVIQTNQQRLKSEQSKLDGYRKQAASLTAAKKPVPKDLAEDIKEAERELQRTQEAIKNKQQEQTNIRAKFDADKMRFRELKGIMPAQTVPTPVAPAKK